MGNGGTNLSARQPIVGGDDQGYSGNAPEGFVQWSPKSEESIS